MLARRRWSDTRAEKSFFPQDSVASPEVRPWPALLSAEASPRCRPGWPRRPEQKREESSMMAIAIDGSALRASDAASAPALSWDGARELTSQEANVVSGGNWFTHNLSEAWKDTFNKPISYSKADAAGVRGSDRLARRLGEGSIGEVPVRLIGYDVGFYSGVFRQLSERVNDFDTTGSGI